MFNVNTYMNRLPCNCAHFLFFNVDSHAPPIWIWLIVETIYNFFIWSPCFKIIWFMICFGCIGQFIFYSFESMPASASNAGRK